MQISCSQLTLYCMLSVGPKTPDSPGLDEAGDTSRQKSDASASEASDESSADVYEVMCWRGFD